MLRFNQVLFLRMLRFGLPSGFHFFTKVAAFTVFVLLIGRLGDLAHFAGNIALSINLIAFMPMIGMGIAASILVGQCLVVTIPLRRLDMDGRHCRWDWPISALSEPRL